jgi:hypothetical protein
MYKQSSTKKTEYAPLYLRIGPLRLNWLIALNEVLMSLEPPILNVRTKQGYVRSNLITKATKIRRNLPQMAFSSFVKQSFRMLQIIS